MDKNTITGFVLIAALLIGFSWYNKPSDEEIAACTKNCIKEFVAMNDSDWKLSMRDMKTVLTKVQETYPMANGKIVSKVLKEYIG